MNAWIRSLLAGASLLLVSGLAAQETDLAGVLATGDRRAVENARRRLAVGDSGAVPVAVCRRLLKHDDEFRRRAAVALLLLVGRGADGETVVAALADDRPEVRELAIPDAGAVALRVLIGQDDDSAVREAAFGRLFDMGGVDDDAWVAALGDADERFVGFIAERLVFESVPFPRAVLARIPASARRTVLEALAERPRAAAEPWLRDLVDTDEVPAVERLTALVALPPASWTRTDTRALLAGLLDTEGDARTPALDGLDLAPAKITDSLIADVHRQVVGGADVDLLLEGMRNVSRDGERHLLALARALSQQDRGKIANWLALRDSPVLGEIVVEALDGDYPLEADLLRRAGPHLTTPARVERALSILQDDDDEAMRYAAFAALTDHGAWHDALLDYVLAGGVTDTRSRAGELLAVPLDAIPEDAWASLLAMPNDRVQRLVLGRLAEAPEIEEVGDRLRAVALEGGAVGNLAAGVCIARGDAELARSVWEALDDARRHALVLSWRRRTEDWVLPLLAPMTIERERYELPFTRIALGDRSALEALLENPGAWPVRWLRRMNDVVPPRLDPRDVAGIDARLRAGDLDEARRLELVQWLAARPDLDGAAVLRRVRSGDDSLEVRVAATRGLLRRAAPAQRIRAGLVARLAAGLDQDDRDLVYEVLGKLEPPLDLGAATFVAQVVLVEPLGHPDQEVAVALREEPVADVALLNQLWQLLGRAPSPHGRAAFDAAARQAREHPNAPLAARERLGRLLAVLAREAATRSTLAPVVADLVLATPDLDAKYVGAAWLIRAEALERAGDWAAAESAWRRASRGVLRAPLEPLVRRSFVGERYRGAGLVPAAFLTSRSHVCAARAAHARGEPAVARAALGLAAELALGDDEAMRAVAAARSEIER